MTAMATQQELENLRRVFVTMDANSDGRISERELALVLANLEYKPRRGEIADMIWEVDEDCDGHVSWAEFELMYMRCKADQVCTRMPRPRALRARGWRVARRLPA